MDVDNFTDVVYLHFAKMFDSLNHRLLLAKLKSFGTGEKVV